MSEDLVVVVKEKNIQLSLCLLKGILGFAQAFASIVHDGKNLKMVIMANSSTSNSVTT